MTRRLLDVVTAGIVGYQQASAWQTQLHRRRVAGEVPDTVLMLEHPHVYTLGRRHDAADLLFDKTRLTELGIEVHETDRGGKITYHGPGQLIAYTIVHLAELNRSLPDGVRFLRLLEQAMVETAAHFGVEAVCRHGLTGVWVGEAKLGSIGIRLSRGVTKHGLSLNVCPDLDYFEGIIPCGISDCEVTSLERLLGVPVSVDEAAEVLKARLAELLNARPVEQPRRVPLARKPVWLRNRVRTGPNFGDLKKMARGLSLHTVCEEARCPNIYECWEAREATFLILGDKCTRKCGFCDITTGRPGALDFSEPLRVAEAVAHMGLNYAVITGVERDDASPREVASIWAATIRAIRGRLPGCKVEVLTGDLKGDRAAIEAVLDVAPDVFAHNVETIRRLHPKVRPGFRYDRSLEVLSSAKEIAPGIPTKSNLIVGMGETRGEVAEALADIRSRGVDLMTIGQYLSPSDDHLPVQRWVTPEEFAHYKSVAEELGFAWVESGPLVRSSYKAGKQYEAAMRRLTRTL